LYSRQCSSDEHEEHFTTKTQKCLNCCQIKKCPFKALNFQFFTLTNHIVIFIYVLIKTNNKKPQLMKTCMKFLKPKLQLYWQLINALNLHPKLTLWDKNQAQEPRTWTNNPEIGIKQPLPLLADYKNHSISAKTTSKRFTNIQKTLTTNSKQHQAKKNYIFMH